MKPKIFLSIAMVMLITGGVFAVDKTSAFKTYYVAPMGNDSNPGTIERPFLTIQKAQAACVPGDTVYIRGGKYTMQNSQIAKTDNLYAYVTYLDKSGTDKARIHYLAYPGEKPVFEFSNIAPPGLRITAFFVKASYITIKGLDVKGVQTTITSHTQSECFRNEGSWNSYEGLTMHDGKANGFYLTKGGNNLILNCDAYNNWDDVSENKRGGNTDGFGCHPKSARYTGNVFKSCRAWFNSDDGFDCINALASITFENCQAFYNGYSSSFVNLADGNGFKMGGFGIKDLKGVPAVIPHHQILFCLAVGNKSAGFYANHHMGGNTWYNNTAYKNGVNFNMLNRSADFTRDVPGYAHVMKNNLGYKARSKEINNINLPLCDASNNYFQLNNVKVTDADFASLDEALLTQRRNASFGLPVSNFMHLTKGSDIIDKGIAIGFSYAGKHPDPGCFEYADNKSQVSDNR